MNLSSLSPLFSSAALIFNVCIFILFIKPNKINHKQYRTDSYTYIGNIEYRKVYK